MPGVNVDAVLFDMDGVLVDSEVVSGQVWVQTLTEHGLPLGETEFMAQAMGSSVPNLYAALEREYNWIRPQAFEAVLEQRLTQAFSVVQEVPGAALTLKALSAAGLPFAVGSNSTRHRLHLKLKSAGLAELLGQHVYDPLDVDGRGKPLPDLYRHAARQLGADIGRCLVVEDSLPGLQAGLSAGAASWGFVGGGHGADGPALLAAGAERVVASHAELRQLLGLNRRAQP